MHRVISTEAGKIMRREIFCFCCQWHNNTTGHLQAASTRTSALHGNYMYGKFLSVQYEGGLLGGQVLLVIGNESEVNCMQQLGRKNKFAWPQQADSMFYCTTNDALKVVPEPEILIHSTHS